MKQAIQTKLRCSVLGHALKLIKRLDCVTRLDCVRASSPHNQVLKQFLLFFTTAFLIACHQLIPLSPQVQRPPQILVAAATSLKTALQEITLLYESNQSLHKHLTYSFAASGALQQQIEQGAPIDLFISAAQTQMDALAQKGLLVPGSRLNLLTNQLVLVASKQGDRTLKNFRDLTQPNIHRIAIGEPRSVPAGQYATEVFQNLGILESIQSKLTLASNVQSVLTAVETGDADAGMVYLTDAKQSEKVRIVAIASSSSHSPILYPIALVQSSSKVDKIKQNIAKQYIEFLQSNAAHAVFQKYGFGIVPPLANCNPKVDSCSETGAEGIPKKEHSTMFTINFTINNVHHQQCSPSTRRMVEQVTALM
jgi:molybdate transport system substrate-binding protein